MAKYLAKIGVHSAEDLRKMGYMQAYLKLKPLNPRFMNRMALYAVYGALSNQNCMKLPRALKDVLETELQEALAKAPKSTKTKSIPLDVLP